MQAPARDPGDFGIALRAESTLLIPEIAKSTGTPKRFQHVSPFPFFEAGAAGSFHANRPGQARRSLSLNMMRRRMVRQEI